MKENKSAQLTRKARGLSGGGVEVCFFEGHKRSLFRFFFRFFFFFDGKRIAEHFRSLAVFPLSPFFPRPLLRCKSDPIDLERRRAEKPGA